MRLVLIAAAGLLLAACVSQHKIPGQTVIGSFHFGATLTASSCAFAEQPDGGLFFYDATFSYDPDGGAFMTVADVDRDGGFDGQIFESWASANRLFNECDCGENVTVNEHVEVALLSKTQGDAVGGRCPANPLDGGVPAPNDAGILAPSNTPNGYDAVLACGEQVDDVVPGADCKCGPCSYRYQLEGTRK